MLNACVYEVGGDCRLRSCSYLYFSAARYLLPVPLSPALSLLRSFISESIRGDPARGIAHIRKYQHVCVSAASRSPALPI